MICVSQIPIPIDGDQKEVKNQAARLLGIRVEDIRSFRVIRQSIDARKKTRYIMYLLWNLKLQENKVWLRKRTTPILSLFWRKRLTLFQRKPKGFQQGR